MANFTFKCQMDDGQTVNVTPVSIKPFGAEELLKSFNGVSQSYSLQIVGKNLTINGEVDSRFFKINTEIVFKQTPLPYALVPGGWLPMPLAMPTNFMVDRNVVAQLKNIKSGAQRLDTEAVEWWGNFFKDGTATFNPLSYAWESSKRRMPTYDEFYISIAEGTQELRMAFPLCKVIQFDEHALSSVYEVLSSFQARAEMETQFLVKVCPLIANIVAKGKEHSMLKQVIQIAKAHGIVSFSPIFTATISCLYEDNTGRQFSIGRKLLKPKAVYSPEMAFNAISDMRQLELTVAGHGCFGSEAFHLATCDKALAALWCAIEPIGEVNNESNITINYHLNKILTPRLSQEELESIIDTIRAEF